MDGRYVVDAVGVSKGADDGELFLLHNAELAAEADLGALVGADGLTVGAHLLANFGGRPNDSAETLQGVDNIEVGEAHAKLYEAWVEQALAGGIASVRVGLSDLNAEFYQNDAAGLLIAPAFGVGSELAATGPNGPSIFPSTALTGRLAVKVGANGYARAAVVNAKAGVLGDPDGVDFRMRDGALLIAEGGSTANGKIAVGVWRYTKRQDDVRALDPLGRPVRRVANGAYLIVDQQVSGGEERGTHLFFRAGLSDGKTTPFRGGFQAGILLRGPIGSRPEGQLSFGLQHGVLARGFRRNLLDEGYGAHRAETGVELTYSDRLAPHFRLQPDVQYIRRAYADGGRDTVIVGLRAIVSVEE